MRTCLMIMASARLIMLDSDFRLLLLCASAVILDGLDNAAVIQLMN